MRSSQLDEIGDKNAPVGSRPHIIYFEGLAEQFRNRLDSDVEVLRKALAELEAASAWKTRGSMSWGHYVAERFRLDGDDLAAIRSAQSGETLRSTLRTAAAARATTGDVRTRSDNQHAQIAQAPQDKRAAEVGISRRTQQKLDALARRAPELLAEVKAGRLSAHRASVKAGIVRDATPFERVVKLLAKLDQAELRAVAAEASRLAGAKA